MVYIIDEGATTRVSMRISVIPSSDAESALQSSAIAENIDNAETTAEAQALIVTYTLTLTSLRKLFLQ